MNPLYRFLALANVLGLGSATAAFAQTNLGEANRQLFSAKLSGVRQPAGTPG